MSRNNIHGEIKLLLLFVSSQDCLKVRRYPIKTTQLKELIEITVLDLDHLAN